MARDRAICQRDVSTCIYFKLCPLLAVNTYNTHIHINMHNYMYKNFDVNEKAYTFYVYTSVYNTYIIYACYRKLQLDKMLVIYTPRTIYCVCCRRILTTLSRLIMTSFSFEKYYNHAADLCRFIIQIPH